MDTNPSAETKYRTSRRWLLTLLVLLFPSLWLAGKLSDQIGSNLLFGLTAILFMVALVVVSLWSFVSYCRWTGKYPFYWLVRK